MLDGPAHVYNARLILSFLGDAPGHIREYIGFSEGNLTNWTGHLILGLLLLLMKAGLAIKVFLALLLISLAYSCRYFLRSFQKASPWLSWMIFPLLWSSFIYLGFFNFLWGLVFGFLLAGVVVRTDRFNARSLLLMFAFATLSALSHTFSFGIMLLLSALFLMANSVSKSRQSGEGKAQLFIRLLRRALLLFLICIPGLIVLLWPLMHTSGIPPESAITVKGWPEIIKWIRKLQPLVGIDKQEEQYTAKLFYLLALSSAGILIWRVILLFRNKASKNSEGARPFLNKGDLLAMMALLSLASFVVISRYYDKGYYVPVRLLYLAYLFGVMWVAVQQIPKWTQAVLIAASLVIAAGSINIRYEILKNTPAWPDIFEKAGAVVPEGSVVYPVCYESNWLNDHTVDLLGASKPMVILENYECNQSYFPLRWTPKYRPFPAAGTDYPFIKCTNQAGDTLFDYLLVFKDHPEPADPLYDSLMHWTKIHYEKLYESPEGNILLLKPVALPKSFSGATGSETAPPATGH
jgi:MFS family permease